VKNNSRIRQEARQQDGTVTEPVLKKAYTTERDRNFKHPARSRRKRHPKPRHSILGLSSDSIFPYNAVVQLQEHPPQEDQEESDSIHACMHEPPALLDFSPGDR